MPTDAHRAGSSLVCSLVMRTPQTHYMESLSFLVCGSSTLVPCFQQPWLVCSVSAQCVSGCLLEVSTGVMAGRQTQRQGTISITAHSTNMTSHWAFCRNHPDQDMVTSFLYCKFSLSMLCSLGMSQHLQSTLRSGNSDSAPLGEVCL